MESLFSSSISLSMKEGTQNIRATKDVTKDNKEAWSLWGYLWPQIEVILKVEQFYSNKLAYLLVLELLKL